MEDLLIQIVVGAILAILMYCIFVDFVADIWATKVILKPWPMSTQQRVIRYSYVTAYSTAVILWCASTNYVVSLFN